jgi:hypothetical protein
MMDRRGFLTALLATATVAAAPIPFGAALPAAAAEGAGIVSASRLPQIAKAWVVFTGHGVTHAYNVTSVEHHGIGDYTIHFGTAFDHPPTAIMDAGDGHMSLIREHGQRSCRVLVQDGGFSPADPERLMLAAFGF